MITVRVARWQGLWLRLVPTGETRVPAQGEWYTAGTIARRAGYSRHGTPERSWTPSITRCYILAPLCLRCRARVQSANMLCGRHEELFQRFFVDWVAGLFDDHAPRAEPRTERWRRWRHAKANEPIKETS